MSFSLPPATVFIGGLEIPNPDRANGFVVRDLAPGAKTFKEKLDEFNSRAAGPSQPNVQQVLDVAWEKYRAAEELASPGCDVTKAAGNAESLVLHLHYPPVDKYEQDPPNALMHEQGATTIRLLKRCGFDGENAFWVDTCPRRYPITIDDKPFCAFNLPPDALDRCLEHVDDVYRAVNPKFVVLFGKPNHGHFKGKWEREQRLQIIELGKEKIFIVFTDQTRQTIQHVVVLCAHPAHLLSRVGPKDAGERFNFALECAAQMAGVVRSEEQKGYGRVRGPREGQWDDLDEEDRAYRVARLAAAGLKGNAVWLEKKANFTDEEQAAYEAQRCEANKKLSATKLSNKLAIGPSEDSIFCGFEDCPDFFAGKPRWYEHKRIKNHWTAEELAEKQEQKDDRAALPFQCDFPGCDGGFTNQKALNRHKKTHDKPTLVCGIDGCQESSFPRSTSLWKHQKEAHPNAPEVVARLARDKVALEAKKATKRPADDSGGSSAKKAKLK